MHMEPILHNTQWPREIRGIVCFLQLAGDHSRLAAAQNLQRLFHEFLLDLHVTVEEQEEIPAHQPHSRISSNRGIENTLNRMHLNSVAGTSV